MARQSVKVQSVYFPDTLWDAMLHLTRRLGGTNASFLRAAGEKLLAGELDINANPTGAPMPAEVIIVDDEPKPSKPHEIRPSRMPDTNPGMSNCCHEPLVEAEEGSSLVTRCSGCRNFISMREKK